MPPGHPQAIDLPPAVTTISRNVDVPEGAATVLRACLSLLLLLIVIGLSPGDAQAHAGMVSDTAATASVGIETAGTTVPAAPAGRRMPHDHVPGGMSCLTAAGCSGVGSVVAEAPAVPAPGSVTAADPQTVLRPPRGIDLPLDDRPPRPA